MTTQSGEWRGEPPVPEVTCGNGHRFTPTGKPWECPEEGCDLGRLAVRLSDVMTGRPWSLELLASGTAFLIDDRPIFALDYYDPLEDNGFERPIAPLTPVTDPVAQAQGDYTK